MVNIDLIANSSYGILGAATDSLVMVLAYSGAVAFLVLMVGVFIGIRSEDGFLRWLRIKPLLAPSFAFVITLVLVIALVPHPMAAYHGLNQDVIYSHQYDTSTFRVYDSNAYQNAVEIHVLCFLTSTETLTVRINFSQNSTMVAQVEITMSGNSLDDAVTADQVILLQPGQYDIEVPGSNYYSVTLSQPLVSGFFNEVLTWESYTFILIAGSFFFILGGLCIGREKRTRFRQEEVDEEPPKDGAAYARQFVG